MSVEETLVDELTLRITEFIEIAEKDSLIEIARTISKDCDCENCTNLRNLVNTIEEYENSSN